MVVVFFLVLLVAFSQFFVFIVLVPLTTVPGGCEAATAKCFRFYPASDVSRRHRDLLANKKQPQNTLQSEIEKPLLLKTGMRDGAISNGRTILRRPEGPIWVHNVHLALGFVLFFSFFLSQFLSLLLSPSAGDPVGTFLKTKRERECDRPPHGIVRAAAFTVGFQPDLVKVVDAVSAGLESCSMLRKLPPPLVFYPAAFPYDATMEGVTLKM